jgi:glutathione S-transferase
MSIQHLKLYHYPVSRSTRVKWMLHEVLGDSFEVERFDLYGAGQYAPEFLQINPNHSVPVLEITWADGAVQRMTESAAMVAFLADAFPHLGFAPPVGASPQRAAYLQMLHYASTWMDMMLWQIRIHEHVLPDSQKDPRTIGRYRNKFQNEVEPQLIEKLKHGGFAFGDTFSAADCVLGHTIFWAAGYGMCQNGIFKEYVSRLLERPAFKKAISDVREFVMDARTSALSLHFTG